VILGKMTRPVWRQMRSKQPAQNTKKMRRN
jgi:hypothetical protein